MLDTKYLQRWRELASAPKEDIVWNTTIISAYAVNEDDDWWEVVKSIKRDREYFKKAISNRVRKKELNGTRWRGAFEIDLVKVDDIKADGHKEELLKGMGVDWTGKTHVVVFHFHGIFHPSVSRACFSGHMKAMFPGSRRILNKGLFKDQSAYEAVTNLHNYSHKRMLQYGDGGYGDVKRKFHTPYEHKWRERISMTYDDSFEFSSTK